MKTTIFQAQSKDGFQFSFQIEKSIVEKDGDDLVVSGVATTNNVDHHNERMANSAIESMVKIINEQGVPLRWEHGKDSSAVIGKVFKGYVDGRNQLKIDARLDKSHPQAVNLYEALKKGERYGLSVGGRIMSASREMAQNIGKYVKTFYDVLLDEVSVTKKPANYDAWLSSVVEKSQDSTIRKSELSYSRFIFENPQFDYLAQFAKSIPQDSWKEITNLEDNKKTMKETMPKEDEKKDETEKSFVTKAQFDQFSTTMTKAITDLAGVVKAAMDVPAKDTTNPDKSKEEEIGDKQVAKDAADGDDGKPAGDEPAKDQTNPDEDKEEDGGQQTAKAEEDEEKDEAEKSEESEDEEKDETEKAGGEDMKEDEGDENDETEKGEDELPKDLKNAMKSMQKAIDVIETTTKKLKGVKRIVKSQSSESELGAFVKSVQSFVWATEDRLAKSGKRIPGFASIVADRIRSDSSLQKELGLMAREPGFKKSISVGSPFIVSKEGRKYSLTATPLNEEKVEKSQNGKAVRFQDIYKSKYSAIREAGYQE